MDFQPSNPPLNAADKDECLSKQRESSKRRRKTTRDLNPSRMIFDNRVESLLTKKELSQILKISVSYINKLMKKGLPYFRIGRSVRFRCSEVVIFLERRKS